MFSQNFLEKKNVSVELTESIADLGQNEFLIRDREALVNIVRKNS
jgi:hypothetical protein